MEILHAVLSMVMVLCSLNLIFFILVQDGKSGDLVVDTQGVHIEGVTNPVRRATGFIAAIWLVSAIMLAVLNTV